jgi:hypothetical protein
MIPKNLADEMKDLINLAREKGLTYPVSDAFKMFPTEEEGPESNKEYWLKKEEASV